MKNKVCKKCNKPLPDGYKHKKCESCIGKQAYNIKKVFKVVGGAAGTLLSLAVVIATKGRIVLKK